MLGTIVFIDDNAAVRRTYTRRLKRIFGEDYKIECPELVRNVEEMLHVLDKIEDKVTYFVDEDLVHEGIADFMGSDLIEKIRVNEPNTPIYILTSDLTRVDESMGDIEFAIDKNSWDEKKDKYAQRFLRHINTLKKIKTEQAARFDELFAKSLTEPLSADEKLEYDELNVLRSKTLIDEAIISSDSVAELDRQSALLKKIYDDLKSLEDNLGDE